MVVYLKYIMFETKQWRIHTVQYLANNNQAFSRSSLRTTPIMSTTSTPDVWVCCTSWCKSANLFATCGNHCPYCQHQRCTACTLTCTRMCNQTASSTASGQNARSNRLTSDSSGIIENPSCSGWWVCCECKQTNNPALISGWCVCQRHYWDSCCYVHP